MNDLLHGTNQSVYLRHYGVKGMRWGVRKGVKSGTAKVNAYVKKAGATTMKAVRSPNGQRVVAAGGVLVGAAIATAAINAPNWVGRALIKSI